MDIYKQGVLNNVGFITSKGELNIIQLATLSRSQLAIIVRSLKKQLTKDSDDELSFLDDTAIQVNSITQLKFDIAKDIYLTKKAEAEEIKNEAETKIHNQKILGLIQQKQNAELEDKSIDELEALLKK